MTKNDIRKSSVEKLQLKWALDFSALPFLGSDLELRSSDKIIYRTLALNLVVAKAYGLPSGVAMEWLKDENILEHVTPDERRFIEENVGQAEMFKALIEALWMLTWVLGVHEEFDPFGLCSNDLVHMLPNLKDNDAAEAFKAKVKTREKYKVLEALDLLYCMDWAATESVVSGQASDVVLPDYAIINRRHVLEWCLSEASWDEISLDT